MPTYDMICGGCKHEFVDVHAMSEPDKKKCPECKTNKLARAWKKPAYYQNTYSPLHPRRSRGMGPNFKAWGDK